MHARLTHIITITYLLTYLLTYSDPIDINFTTISPSYCSAQECINNISNAARKSPPAWWGIWYTIIRELTSCAGGRHNMPPPPASWPLTFWPWKSCPSHVWRGLPLCQF